MALIACEDCGARVSEDARACPQCGRSRTSSLILVGAIVTMVSIPLFWFEVWVGGAVFVLGIAMFVAGRLR